MVSVEEVEEHLRLAEGFITSAFISPDASECDVRNAFSRGYYALLHVCKAWLAMMDVSEDLRYQHGQVLREIGSRRGEDSKRRLKDIYGLREDADYRPQMFTARPFFGDIERFRAVASAWIADARAEFDLYAVEVRQFLTKE